MKPTSIRTRIIYSFLLVITMLALLVGIFGAYVINSNIVGREQKQMVSDITIARKFYNAEIEKLKDVFSFMGEPSDLKSIRIKLRLDYLDIVKRSELPSVKSEIVKRAFETGASAGGTRIIDKDELKKMGAELYERARMPLVNTPMALPTERKELENAMAIGCASPLSYDSAGKVDKVIYGGRLLNRDLQLVDAVRGYVFEEQLYKGKPLGTVTIFQDDVRIATNVLDRQGSRALGTRISKDVYERVAVKGGRWFDRAFVVTDWYLTAYEPIRDIEGKVIGILYVGTLEEPFRDMKRNILIMFLGIVAVASVFAALLAFFLEFSMTRPIDRMLEATEKISGGDLAFRVMTRTPIKELNKFARSFNLMAVQLSERERTLKDSNIRYLDLVGFVSHELKGILASTMLHAYSVRDGFLGMINFKQRKALDSVVKNLEYFDSTVKNFLNLSRIEKDEMPVNRTDLLLGEDLLDQSVQEFFKPAAEKSIVIENNIARGIKVRADFNLMQIVANNLVGNAVKYGSANGKVSLNCVQESDRIKVEVYNDGKPLTGEETQRLFKRFSRLDNPETKKNKGTGLGLFISRQIIEKHGGSIRVESRDNGNSFIFEIAQNS
ncbi:MAG: cache domain-containing protein [Candidatus Margulisiibacteriota bacterium]